MTALDPLVVPDLKAEVDRDDSGDLGTAADDAEILEGGDVDVLLLLLLGSLLDPEAELEVARSRSSPRPRPRPTGVGSADLRRFFSPSERKREWVRGCGCCCCWWRCTYSANDDRVAGSGGEGVAFGVGRNVGGRVEGNGAGRTDRSCRISFMRDL